MLDSLWENRYITALLAELWTDLEILESNLELCSKSSFDIALPLQGLSSTKWRKRDWERERGERSICTNIFVATLCVIVKY